MCVCRLAAETPAEGVISMLNGNVEAQDESVEPVPDDDIPSVSTTPRIDVKAK